MKTRLLRLVALSAALAPNLAGAIGFGDILLHSRIGEALLAEVPLHGDDDELPDASCFSVKPPPASEFPGITTATIKVVRHGGNAHLLITNNAPILEPIIVLGLRAGCRLNLEHQYVLMPQAPLAQPDPGIDTAPPDKARKPDAARNPRQGELTGNPAKGLQQAIAGQEEARPTPSKKPSARAAKTGDRLLLEVPSDNAGVAEKDNPHASRLSKMRVRVEKLEHSLALLNRELDSMHAIMSESVELLDAPVKLQLAQSIEPQPQTQAAPRQPPMVQSTNPESSHWHELLISALLGGGISVGVAHLLARRREGISPG